MKKMELHITLTFSIMFVVSFIINGIHSVLTMGSNFITFEVVAHALFAALVYLGCVELNATQHQFLNLIGLLSVCIVATCITSSSDLLSRWFGRLDWKFAVMAVYYAIAVFIAVYQGQKLLEEDKHAILFPINVEEDLHSEDI